MKEIALSNGGAAIVDDADYPILAHWKWKRHRCGYASRTVTGGRLGLHALGLFASARVIRSGSDERLFVIARPDRPVIWPPLALVKANYAEKAEVAA